MVAAAVTAQPLALADSKPTETAAHRSSCPRDRRQRRPIVSASSDPPNINQPRVIRLLMEPRYCGLHPATLDGEHDCKRGRHTARGRALTVKAEANPTRRDFLYIATATVGAFGTGAAIVPLIGQMNPDASTLAAGGPVEVDLSKVSSGQQIVVQWRSRPIFIINRTQAVLQTLQDPQFTEQLADPESKELQQPPYADNWHRSVNPQYVVLVGICTHLGCIPEFFPQPNASQPAANWMGGYFCPCHGSKYDLAGRVFKGVPAPYNLPVPPYHFITDTTIRIGENPDNVNFDFGSIQQI
jgi:ubiquinol-cytochrome c reductase iron-sulfur subunit